MTIKNTENKTVESVVKLKPNQTRLNSQKQKQLSW